MEKIGIDASRVASRKSDKMMRKEKLFKILLVLSTISGVWNFVFGFLGFFTLRNSEVRAQANDQYAELMINWGLAQNEEEARETVGQILDVAPGLLLTTALIGACTVLAVFFMHKRRLLGFHVYVAAQILGVFAPWLLFNSEAAGFPLGPLLISTIFVLLYRRFLPLLH